MNPFLLKLLLVMVFITKGKQTGHDSPNYWFEKKKMMKVYTLSTLPANTKICKIQGSVETAWLRRPNKGARAAVSSCNGDG